MRSVSARQVNQEFSKILEAAVRGEEITITRRGVPVAKMVPIERESADRMRTEREREKEEIIAWLRQGPIKGPAPNWTRDELYEPDPVDESERM